jgi:hypothetical protein
MDLRFSHHARNKLRLYKIAVQDVESAVESGEKLQYGDKWEARFKNLRVIWVMIGDYAMVITVIRTR